MPQGLAQIRRVAIIAALALSGLAAGMAVPSLAACVANAVPIEQMGTASAALQVCTQIGVVSGIQVMESVEVARAHAGIVGSFHDSYLVAALAALVTTGVAGMVRSTARRGELVVPAAGEVVTAPAVAPEPSLG